VAPAVRTETDAGVRSIVLCRPDEYNTITPVLRDELAAAIDDADADRDVRVILLRADGPAFCAGYGLDWSTQAQAAEASAGERVWDSVADYQMMSRFVATYMKLWYASKPTIAAVQGWCIAGGTDMVLCADLIVAGDSAVFGYPPARVWGTPTTAMWVYRMGLEQAKRYLLTGDEIPAPEAARIGLILEAVPDDELGAWPACRSTSSRCSSCSATRRRRAWGWRRPARSARCSTASRATRRRASTSWPAPRRSGSATPCASATTRSATTARVHGPNAAEPPGGRP
jgi:enoyl-CoA hydratase/carnithine racemase